MISNLIHNILIYLHIIHILKSSTCFEHYPIHLQEVYVVILYIQPLVSSLSAGDCLVHRFLTGAPDFNKCIICKYIRILCIKLEINQGYTTMHGQPIIKNCCMFRPTMWTLQGCKIQSLDALRLRNLIKNVTEQIHRCNHKHQQFNP